MHTVCTYSHAYICAHYLQFASIWLYAYAYIMCVEWCVQASTYPGSRQRICGFGLQYYIGYMYVYSVYEVPSLESFACVVFSWLEYEYFFLDSGMRLVAGCGRERDIERECAFIGEGVKDMYAKCITALCSRTACVFFCLRTIVLG